MAQLPRRWGKSSLLEVLQSCGDEALRDVISGWGGVGWGGAGGWGIPWDQEERQQ